MITLEKLSRYQEHYGDADSWARSGPNGMMSDDFRLIDSLLQDYVIVKNGLGSPAYADEFQRRLDQACDNDQTKAELVKLASTNRFL